MASASLPCPDTAGNRRFARSLLGLEIRVDPKSAGVESMGGAAPPWLPPGRTARVDVSGV
jgi:hypothetical protein